MNAIRNTVRRHAFVMADDIPFLAVLVSTMFYEGNKRRKLKKLYDSLPKDIHTKIEKGEKLNNTDKGKLIRALRTAPSRDRRSYFGIAMKNAVQEGILSKKDAQSIWKSGAKKSLIRRITDTLAPWGDGGNSDVGVEFEEDVKDKRSGKEPPKGYQKVPGSEKGAYRKRKSDGWVYWYPEDGK